MSTKQYPKLREAPEEPGVLLYHITPARNEKAILAGGFREGDVPYFAVDDNLGLTAKPCRGVWFSAQPWPDTLKTLGEFATVVRKWRGPLALFVVRVPADAIEKFELTTPADGIWREWCLPAELVNRCEIVDVRQLPGTALR